MMRAERLKVIQSHLSERNEQTKSLKGNHSSFEEVKEVERLRESQRYVTEPEGLEKRLKKTLRRQSSLRDGKKMA